MPPGGSLDQTLRRELRIADQVYTLTIAAEGLKLVEIGRRKGLELRWTDLVSGVVHEYPPVAFAVGGSGQEAVRLRACQCVSETLGEVPVPARIQRHHHVQTQVTEDAQERFQAQVLQQCADIQRRLLDLGKRHTRPQVQVEHHPVRAVGA